MLAKQRQICIQGKEVAQTPMLVPSFSSKGFPAVQKIIDVMSSVIADAALVSAYDVWNKKISTPITFPDLMFLDSGGYECSKDIELSDLHYQEHRSDSGWTSEKLVSVLDNWNITGNTVFVSYDHPNVRRSVADQIADAKSLFAGRPVGRELLIKPSSSTANRIDVKEVISNIYELRHFDVLGFTEKELGFCLSKRLENIAKIRNALNQSGLDIPIHVFGSLDPVSSPLYFLAGADIFDGLTWLRLAYHNGMAVYIHNFASLTQGSTINDDDVAPKVWFSNYHQMLDLEVTMKRFIKEKTFDCFSFHAEFFEKTYKGLVAKI